MIIEVFKLVSMYLYIMVGSGTVGNGPVYSDCRLKLYVYDSHNMKVKDCLLTLKTYFFEDGKIWMSH